LTRWPAGALPSEWPGSLTRALGVLAIVEWATRSGQAPTWWTGRAATPLRWAAYLWLLAQVWFNFHSPQGFIYFQF
jgi:hypothetical protein